VELAIVWTDFAKKELRKIFAYHKEEASLTIAKELINGIYQTTLRLQHEPAIGQKEELLRDRPQEFRYLV
jgi:plasmid stabilization system protein ParE